MRHRVVVHNVGEPTPGPSRIEVYLPRNRVLNAADFLIQTVDLADVAALGTAPGIRFEYQRRSSMRGWYLIARVDGGETVADGNEGGGGGRHLHYRRQRPGSALSEANELSASGDAALMRSGPTDPPVHALDRRS